MAQQKESFPLDLKCENFINPLGVDVSNPKLSWAIAARSVELKGMRQQAYQVMVASSKQKLSSGVSDVWNSGKTSSDEMQIEYKGKKLSSSRG